MIDYFFIINIHVFFVSVSNKYLRLDFGVSVRALRLNDLGHRSFEPKKLIDTSCIGAWNSLFEFGLCGL